MATYEPSIGDVIRSAIRDAQDLVRSELALAKAEVREEVLTMDANGYLISSDVYGLTPPAEGPSLQTDVFTFFLPIILK